MLSIGTRLFIRTPSDEDVSSEIHFASASSPTTGRHLVETIKGDIEMAIDPSPTGEVSATLNYYLPPAKGGVDEYQPGTAGARRRKHDAIEVSIGDMRGHEADFNLDTQGFQVVDSASIERNFEDEDAITDEYYEECRQLIKRVTGATKVMPFAHLVRQKAHAEALEEEKDLADDARTGGEVAAAHSIHIDQSYNGAVQRVSDVLPDEFKKLGNKRWAIINVWRPVDRPVTRSNLCMCDARSVREEELKETVLHFPGGEFYRGGDGRALNKAYAKGVKDFGLWSVWPPSKPGQHKWWYCSHLQPNEAILLKIYDSKTTGVARRSPHTAFVSPKDYGPSRKSIETRCFVVWDDQTSE